VISVLGFYFSVVDFLLLLARLESQAESWIVVVKLIFIGFFLFMTSPVATHAMAHSAHVVGLRPMLGADLKREGDV